MQYSGKLLPHRKICLKYFVPAHWSSAAQARDLELQPGISDIQEWCAGSVLHCLSASTLHGFSPQGTGSHGNWDWRSQMCKFITKSISPRMTHCILVPSKWRNAFGTAFDSYPTALRIRAAWKAHLNLHECIVNKVFWILLLSVDNSSFFPLTVCGKITHGREKKKKHEGSTCDFCFPHQNQFWKHTLKQLARNSEGLKGYLLTELRTDLFRNDFAD